MIYLDNAATSYHKPDCVVRAVSEALQHMGNAGRGVHNASLDASRMIYETRCKISDMFNLKNPNQAAFTANSTESLNIAIQGIFKQGDHVITTSCEHNSVLRPLYFMESMGVEVTIIPADRNGNISCNDFINSIKPNTKGIVCTHASNLTGNLIDIEYVGKICRQHGLIFIVDASQTAGVFEIDMQKMNIDVLCFTGHKSLMGPQGTGGICLREKIKIRPLLSGGSGIKTFLKEHPSDMPVALEAGTLNGHGIAGLNAALSYIMETGISNIRNKERALMEQFYDGVVKLPQVKIYGDFSTFERAPVVALNIGDYDSGEVADELFTEYGISTRAGAHCAPLMHKALGTEKQGAVRFSFSCFNTGEEVEAAVNALKRMSED